MEKVFGLHAVESLLRRDGGKVVEIYVQQGRRDKRLGALIDLAKSHSVAVVECPRAKLDDLVSGRHQGVVALAEAAPSFDEKALPGLLAERPDALVLVLDGVTDPHNLGACLRSADAAGVAAVIAPKDNAVGLTATVRKVACGAAESVPFVAVTNLSRTLKALQDAGLWVVGMAGEAEQMLYDIDLKGPVALVMGAEGSGLRRLTREHCDFLAKLPMAGSVSSLNVSVATGVCLFEAVRQRR
ncbi:23S rRNA (guanosine(2251)-2'-O)-methyltransferase RlmB [Spongiibacter nanhainus]|uniref:23S rRNA (guanosine-2'-O-)-methyltransferase RlmB n=1 Tax=Spongiibacter nanhainus TaxID=2794344 RepID=A0A7T4QZG9_9GAMM|nr:23S rRNA (guanosine(2251)-2'-O)-methyltransferase RlmB [Spongiibacter nanhainus]QQD17665.1 23S rRNA (guanosine(2251)-2'-O)-methyltransferase RlmB [Spongiibacter nanhainus]